MPHPVAVGLTKLINGKKIDKPSGIKGGSPNQNGEKRARFLLWALRYGNKKDKELAVENAIEFFTRQLREGHMLGEMFITGRHYHIWTRLYAGFLAAIPLLDLSNQRHDALRALIVNWGISEFASYPLHATPDGSVVAIGTRAILHDEGLGMETEQRNTISRLLLNLPQQGRAKNAKGYWDKSNEVQVGVVVIRENLHLFKTVSNAARNHDFTTLASMLPGFQDHITINRYANGHISTAPLGIRSHNSPQSWGTTCPWAGVIYGQEPQYEFVHVDDPFNPDDFNYGALGEQVFCFAKKGVLV